MVSLQNLPSAQRRPRVSQQSDQGKLPQGIERRGPRRSAHPQSISLLSNDSECRKTEQRPLNLSPKEDHPPSLPLKDQKRSRQAESPANHIPIECPQKRLRSSLAGPCRKQAFDQEAASGLSASQRSHIGNWADQKTWPKEYLQQDSMHHLIARQKSTTSLRRKRSDASLAPPATPSDQRPREEKTAPYKYPNYPTLLETLGNSYMDESELGITDASTLFRDDAFRTACGNLRDKNEARIIQDIGRLLVPSSETLAALGAEDLRVLNESVNEGWNNYIPVTSPRPQPDFSVGFRRSVFSDDQLSKLQPLLGDPSYLSYFRATYYMYFPVLTCEAKCGTAGLDIADRQNAHSMTLAVRGIVQLFKLARKEDTLHRELLTFSVSHDHRTVRLYGYYPIIDGPKTKIYRHPIHTFDITALGGEERWTTYKFTVGVYNYLLTLLGKIRSIIDELPPDFSLKLAQSSEQQFSEAQLSEPSGQSQQLGDQNLAEVPISQPNHVYLQQITPDPSMQAEKPATKKKKKGKGKG